MDLDGPRRSQPFHSPLTKVSMSLNGAPEDIGQLAEAASVVAADKDDARAATRRPLAGIRVLDLTNVLSGPFCAYQLAQLGAEVVKIEIPGTGDLARQLGADEKLNAQLMGASFLAQNGGKKSVTVNLKTEEGRGVLRDLARTADVLVENFRPGVMDRLGVGHNALTKVNPSLVYCAISGFGQTGPMRDAPAYDQIIQGLAGVMSITGDARCAPMRVGYPVADTIGGLTAAFAISSALVRRASTGEGAFIDVSMLDCMLGTMGWVVSNYLIAGTEPVPMGNDNFTAAPSGAFATASGLINIAANKQEQFEALAVAVGRQDWIQDPKFAHREARKRNRAELNKALERALHSKSASEWEAILNRIGIPAGCVLSVPEALSTAQVAERGLLRTIDGVPGVGRPITVTRAGFKLTGGDPEITSPPPGLGQHTEEVLKDLGYSAEDIGRLRRAGAI
jgi:crotonobetainyl-CoA:carnitine CoA-transferase CaiB-like acyl-CoA transferase